MTDMQPPNNGSGADLEADVRQTLQRHAGDAPHLDLTESSLRRARRFRLRRRLAVTAAAAAVVAVCVPVAATIVDDTRSADVADGPAPSRAATSPVAPVTDIALAGLALGPAPAVPYIVDAQFVHAGRHSDLSAIATTGSGSKHSVVDAATFSDGVGGFVADSDQRLEFRATRATPLPSARAATSPAIDHNGAVAFAVNGVDVDGRPAQTGTVLYADALSAQPSYAYTHQLDVKQVMDVQDRVVLFNAATPDGTQVVGSADLASSGPGSVQQPWPNVVSLSAADQAVGLMVGRTTDMGEGEHQCSAMLSTDGATELWRSCQWRPTEFSPDGSRVFAVSASAAGDDVRSGAILDAKDGTVIRAFTTAGTFGRATFEGDNALDIITIQDGESAIVRCFEDGNCQLAAAARPAETGSLVVPYQLTANP
ncbi:MAG TPA: hypothetical protein VH419_02710 [Nocardioidaceae bacterium]